MKPTMTWIPCPGRVLRSDCGRYAILTLQLSEIPTRTVYQVRRIHVGMYPSTQKHLGEHIGESPYLTLDQNEIHSAEAIAERDLWCQNRNRERSVPQNLPAAALARFYWPTSEGTTRGALAIVREGDRVYARVVGMSVTSYEKGFEPSTYAEIDLTELGVPAGVVDNTTVHEPDPCNCGARVGQPHNDDCGVARCLATGGQRLMCDLFGGSPVAGVEAIVTGSSQQEFDDFFHTPAGHDCGRDVWTGRWPGEAECEEFGWWCQDRCAEGLGFVPCAADAPGATHDLNRLITEATWDAQAARWVR